MSQRWSAAQTEWSGWIDRVLLPGEALDAFTAPVPAPWGAAMALSPTDAVKALWSGAETSLPRFVDYLTRCTTSIALGDGPIGGVLMYFVQDWYEMGDRGFDEGEFVGGPPARPESLASFEAEHGSLPASVREFWQRHSFARTKTDLIIASLDPSPESFSCSPRIYEFGGCAYLTIADADRYSPICLVGESARGPWRDEIVRAYPSLREASPHTLRTLDELLVDWNFRRWDASPL